MNLVMEIKVKLNNFRVAPRKARRVVDLIRGKKAQEAASILSFTVSKSAEPILKLLNSAIASAKNDFKINEQDLFVSRVTVDEGPKIKRWHPMSRGRAYPITKRSSHIILVLSETNENREKNEKPKSKKRNSKPKTKIVSKSKN